MDLRLYLRVMRRFWYVIAVGVVAAVAAGTLAAYSVTSDGLKPRATPLHSASTTLLLEDPSLPTFSVESDPQPSGTEEEPAPQVRRQELSQLSLIYAYIISGDEIRERVSAASGGLTEDEVITAVQRTTQPQGDERFPGRYSLPILDVVAVSTTPERSEELSVVAAEQFVAYVEETQAAQGLDPVRRIDVSVLARTSSTVVDTSSPLLPMLAVAAAVLGATIALVFVLANLARGDAERRRVRRSDDPRGPGAGAAPLPGQGEGRSEKQPDALSTV